MCFRVDGVHKLPRNDAVGNGFREFLGFFYRAFHAFLTVSKDEFGTVGFKQVAALDAHGFRHRQDDAQASRGSSCG